MTFPAFRRWVIWSLLCGPFSGLLSCQASLHMQNAASSSTPSSQPVSPSSSNVPPAVAPSSGSAIVASTAPTIATPSSTHAITQAQDSKEAAEAKVRALNVGLIGADAQLIPSVWVRAREMPLSSEPFEWVIPGGYMYNNGFCFFPEHGDEDQRYRVDFRDSARYSRMSARNTQDQHTNQEIARRGGDASLQFGYGPVSVNANTGGSSTIQVTDLNQEGQQENTVEEYSIERPHLCFSYTGVSNTRNTDRYVLVRLQPNIEVTRRSVELYFESLKPDKSKTISLLKGAFNSLSISSWFFSRATQIPALPISAPIPSVVALPSIALGKNIWADRFGVDVGVEPSLPTSIEDILALPCPFSKGQSTVKDTHILVLIPAKINGEVFSLGALQDLLSRNKVATALRYIPEHQNFGYVANLSDVPVHRSHWILMTKTSVMQDCKLGATKSEQRKDAKLNEVSKSLFDALTTRGSVGRPRYYDYVVPDFLEAVTAMVLCYGNSSERLCKSSPNCQEYIYCTVPGTNNHTNGGDYVLAGNFHMKGDRNTSTGQQACLEIVEHKKSLIGRLHQRKHNCGVACCIDLNM